MTPEKIDRYDNQPETGSLSLAEHATVEAGRLAMSSLNKTLDLWIAIARAIKTLRDKADRLGGRWDFQRLMAQNGFRMDGTPHEKVLDKAIVSKLLTILDRLPEVMAWYEKLTPKQRREWAAPTTVLKHCPVFAKPKIEGERTPTKAEQTTQELAKAQQELYQLRQREDGDTFNAKTTSAKAIAEVLFGQLAPYPGKAEKVADAFLALLKEHKKSKPKTKAGGLAWVEDEMQVKGHRCYRATTSAGEYDLSPAMSFSLGGSGGGRFNGYSIRFHPVGYVPKKQRAIMADGEFDLNVIASGVKTAEKAKAIAQAHADKEGAR